MAPYIQFSTDLWAKAVRKGFEEDLFKLMNNGVSGKTMENLRKCVHIELVRGEEID